MGWITGHLDCRWVQHPVARRIIEARLSAFCDHSWAGVAPFLNSFQDEEARRLITEVVSDRRPIPDPEKTLKGDPGHSDKRGILERLRDEHLAGEINHLTSHLIAREAGTAEQLETYRKIAALKALKRQPVAPLHAAS